MVFLGVFFQLLWCKPNKCAVGAIVFTVLNQNFRLRFYAKRNVLQSTIKFGPPTLAQCYGARFMHVAKNCRSHANVLASPEHSTECLCSAHINAPGLHPVHACRYAWPAQVMGAATRRVVCSCVVSSSAGMTSIHRLLSIRELG